jgi:hypothetical protein
MQLVGYHYHAKGKGQAIICLEVELQNKGTFVDTCKTRVLLSMLVCCILVQLAMGREFSLKHVQARG